jgi:hypothetical protein
MTEPGLGASRDTPAPPPPRAPRLRPPPPRHAANLAVALATRLRLSVGLMDADVHGPSVPALMGVEGEPLATPGGAEAPGRAAPLGAPARRGALAAPARRGVACGGPRAQAMLVRHCNEATLTRSLRPALPCPAPPWPAPPNPSPAEGLMEPLVNYNVKVISMGLFTEVRPKGGSAPYLFQPAADWRGPCQGTRAKCDTCHGRCPAAHGLAAERAMPAGHTPLLHAPSLPSASPARPPPSLMCADTRFDADLQDDTPIVWRGPMATKAMDKMLMGTAWGRLDVLVVDMPPGWCGGGAGPLLYFG